MIERAVVNAGPLVALSLLGQLELLPALFSEIWVPQSVFNEVAVAGIGKPGAQSLQSEEWQKRVRTSSLPDPLLVMELDAGEADVISLARHLSPCIAVIDERRGRRVAQNVYGLPVKGTAGLLVEAHRRGLISGVRARLMALREAGYFIADSVIAAACLAAGESP
jgi:predicted nucleic acid-binding protein